MEKPTIGRIVHFRADQSEMRPAVIVRVWNDDMVQLQVLLDGSNDARHGFTPAECERGLAWKTSVHHGTAVGQWSWPARG